MRRFHGTHGTGVRLLPGVPSIRVYPALPAACESGQVTSDPGQDQTPTDPADTGDTTSDPSKDDGMSADWTDEGGAAPEGPATDPEDGTP